jgi:molecular chaperone DnaK
MASGEKIIGIDLGTTNSVVAVVEGGVPTVIPNPEGNRLTPSVVAYVDGAETHVGEPARRQAVTNPTRTIQSIKRFMGRRFNEISDNDRLVPYKVSKSDSGYVDINVDDKNYSPQEISAKTLRKLKESAEAYLGHKVNKAVITVPAYFNDSQRQATKDAGQIAGLEVARIINEPTAAALAYGLDKDKSERIVVFDLGGGTFDVSVLEVEDAKDGDNEKKLFEVLSTAGDTQLGGDDFDATLLNHVADAFQNEHGVDLRKDTMALQRLHEACEKAKKDLSSVPQTDINLPFITADDTGPKHMQMTITRSTFEEMIDSLVDKCREPVQRALKDAGFTASDIDEVVLVGGSTRIPKVREMVVNLFGKEPHQGVNPDEVVAMGAAIQGSVLAGDRTDVLLLDVTPLTVGIETEGGVMTALVERNTTIPAEKKNVFSTAADNQPAVTVKVFQGERKMAKNNRLLGEFNLEGIPPAPRGVPQIEVTFDIDQNGILNVTAKDLGTQKQSNVRIEDSAGLDDEEIDRMRKDAEEHAEDDKKQFELVEARNKGEQLAYQLEKTMKESGDKLSDADKAPLTAAIEKVRQLSMGEDVKEIAAAVDELEQTAQAFSKTLYEASPTGDGDDAADDDAIDAEFEVKEDDSDAAVEAEDDSDATVEAEGDSDATVEAEGDSDATVEAEDDSDATVEAEDDSDATVEAEKTVTEE